MTEDREETEPTINPPMSFWLGEEGFVAVAFYDPDTMEVIQEIRYTDVIEMEGVRITFNQATEAALLLHEHGFEEAIRLAGLERAPEVDLSEMNLTVEDILGESNGNSGS